MRSSYRHPSLGEGFVSGIAVSPSNLRPFGAPPSIGRRECPHEPLPLEGAAERSEAGLASFFCGEAASSLLSPWGKALSVDIVFSTYAYIRSDNARKAAFSYRSLPHWGRGIASAVDRVLSQTAYLRRSLPALFHSARTLSGSLRSPPSPRGEGFVSGIAVSPYRSLVFSSLRAKMYPHRLSISPRNPRA